MYIFLLTVSSIMHIDARRACTYGFWTSDYHCSGMALDCICRMCRRQNVQKYTPDGYRTHDPSLRKAMLYPLSYGGFKKQLLSQLAQALRCPASPGNALYGRKDEKFS